MEKTMDGNLAIKSVENSATHTEGSQADATRPTESSATDAGTGSEQREPEERGVLPSPEARAGAVKPAVDRVTSVGADDVSNTQAVAAAAKVPCETSSFEAATQDAAAEATDNVGNASLARTADGGSGIKQIADLNACNIAQGNGESVAAQAEVLQYSLAADACKGDEHSQVAVGAQVTSHGGSLASPPNETPSVATDIGGGRSAQTPDIAEDEKPTETDSFKVVEEALPSQEEEEEKGFRSNDGSSSPALLMEVKGSREVAEEALGTLRASFTPEKPLVQDHVTLSSSDAEGRDPVSDKGPGGIAELERSKDPIDADSSTPASAKPVAVLHPSVAYRAPVLFGPDTFILTASGNKVSTACFLCGSREIHMAARVGALGCRRDLRKADGQLRGIYINFVTLKSVMLWVFVVHYSFWGHFEGRPRAPAYWSICLTWKGMLFDATLSRHFQLFGIYSHDDGRLCHSRRKRSRKRGQHWQPCDHWEQLYYCRSTRRSRDASVSAN